MEAEEKKERGWGEGERCVGGAADRSRGMRKRKNNNDLPSSTSAMTKVRLEREKFSFAHRSVKICLCRCNAVRLLIVVDLCEVFGSTLMCSWWQMSLEERRSFHGVCSCSRCECWTCNSAKTQIKQTINTNFFRSWTSREGESEKIRVSIAMLADWRKLLFSRSTTDLPFLSLIVRNDAKFAQVQLEPVQAEVSQLWHARTRHRIWSSNWIIHAEVRLCVDALVRFHLCRDRVDSTQTKMRQSDETFSFVFQQTDSRSSNERSWSCLRAFSNSNLRLFEYSANSL